MRAGLLFESSDGSSRFWLPNAPTEPNVVIIGRHPPHGRPNIRISSDLVARQHAKITTDAIGFMVEDAGSSGGLYLDDEYVRGTARIGPGMRLKLCSQIEYSIRQLTAEPLSDLTRQPISFATARRLAEDILRELVRLHDSDRCHGGVSSSEILHGADGSFVLLARGWSLVDHPIDFATDVYILATILREAVSQTRGLPPALQSWLSSMSMADPRQRPSAREALERLAAHEVWAFTRDPGCDAE